MKNLLIAVTVAVLLSTVMPMQANALLRDRDRCHSFVIEVSQEQFDRSRWEDGVQSQIIDRMEEAHHSCLEYVRTAHGLYQ